VNPISASRRESVNQENPTRKNILAGSKSMKIHLYTSGILDTAISVCSPEERQLWEKYEKSKLAGNLNSLLRGFDFMQKLNLKIIFRVTGAK